MFGILLKDIRQSKGITQKELGEGICNRTTVASYEHETCDPQKLYMDAFLQRLGKSTSKYYIRLDEDEFIQAKQRAWIQGCLRKGKLAKAECAIQEYKNIYGREDKLQRQFVAFVQAELWRMQNIPLEKQKELVFSGLCETIAKQFLTPKRLELRVFHLLEFFLLQRYAILLEEMGDTEQAVLWYEALLIQFEKEDREIADRQTLYPLTAYRLANLRVRQGRVSEALPLLLRAGELLRYSKIQNALYVMIRELEFQVRDRLGHPASEQERNNLGCIREILLESGACVWENYYPIYLEPNICSVNKMLMERRITRGYTREGLVGNICDTRTLERQEKNGSKPQKKHWRALFEELGISYLKYDSGIVPKGYEDYRKFEEMLQAYDKREVEKARELYQELAGNLDMMELTNRQFRKYWDTELKYIVDEISREKRNEELWEMLGWTIPKDRREKGFSCWLTRYEREALESLAWECEGEEITELIPLLKLQLHRTLHPVEQMMSVGFYEKLLYCIARTYLQIGNIKRAEKYITLAIKYRPFQDWGLSWNRILFLRFRVEEKKLGLQKKKNPRKSDKPAFRWARLAWASAREVNDEVMCRFMKGYFKRHYAYKK